MGDLKPEVKKYIEELRSTVELYMHAAHVLEMLEATYREVASYLSHLAQEAERFDKILVGEKP